MNITLIGYRGSGKSTVARLVADRLGWSWIDADTCLEKQAGHSIREIFASEGEAGFRDRETAVIRELAARQRVVVAAGGGAVLRAENREAIKRSSWVAWLAASPEVIAQRIAYDPTTAERRPPLTGQGVLEEIRELLGQREPLYRQCADWFVETDGRSPAEIAELIVQAFNDSCSPVQME